MTVIGTRPEAIKMAPIIRELRRQSDTFAVKVCLTGQHRQLIDGTLELFAIEPDYDLDSMRPAQSLTGSFMSILTALEPVLLSERPDWLLVQGDTTTVLAASMAAYFQRIRLAHVEAGLRTGDKYQPFPEEFNRRVASMVADIHFAPTEWAADNLRREGVPDNRIVVTGNTVIDAVHYVSALPYDKPITPLLELPFGRKRVILVTLHRREQFGDGIIEILSGLRRLADSRTDVQIVYPVHLNPGVREPAMRLLGDHPNITLLPPLDYQPFLWLMRHCHFVITDSGGLQEEAPGLGKPLLVLRDKTERPEAIELGFARLVGVTSQQIVEGCLSLLDDQSVYQRMAEGWQQNIYGDGRAAARIADTLRVGGLETIEPAVVTTKVAAWHGR